MSGISSIVFFLRPLGFWPGLHGFRSRASCTLIHVRSASGSGSCFMGSVIIQSVNFMNGEYGEPALRSIHFHGWVQHLAAHLQRTRGALGLRAPLANLQLILLWWQRLVPPPDVAARRWRRVRGVCGSGETHGQQWGSSHPEHIHRHAPTPSRCVPIQAPSCPAPTHPPLAQVRPHQPGRRQVLPTVARQPGLQPARQLGQLGSRRGRHVHLGQQEPQVYPCATTTCAISIVTYGVITGQCAPMHSDWQARLRPVVHPPPWCPCTWGAPGSAWPPVLDGKWARKYS